LAPRRAPIPIAGEVESLKDEDSSFVETSGKHSFSFDDPTEGEKIEALTLSSGLSIALKISFHPLQASQFQFKFMTTILSTEDRG